MGVRHLLHDLDPGAAQLGRDLRAEGRRDIDRRLRGNIQHGAARHGTRTLTFEHALEREAGMGARQPDQLLRILCFGARHFTVFTGES